MARKTPPTQTAYDRIQQAGTRSRMVIGDVAIVYELCKDGICIAARTEHLRCNKIITWRELALCETDPLVRQHREILEEIAAWKVKVRTDNAGG
jgi:hypothetical protein